MNSPLVVKRSEASTLAEHDVSHFFEYSLPFNQLAVGISEINGHYPQSGYDVDSEVEQVWYVESGQGTVWLQGQEHQVSIGDMILVPKGEKYWIDGIQLKLVVASSPPWFSQQHQHVEF